jgi:hypothetical protein
LLPSVVPVLPATSRSSSAAAVPVPSSTTVFRTSVTLSATGRVKAVSVFATSACLNFVPSLSLISLTEYGSFCSPLAAKVAYAPAIRIALGSDVPSEKDG